MAKLALLTHSDEQLPRRLRAALDRALAQWFEVRVDKKPLPDSGFEAVVVLGGKMGAYEIDAFPWLVEEKEFLRRQVDNSMPVLGICLGSQLLAEALGGSAFLAPAPEVGVVPIQLTDAGKRHEVMRVIGDQVLCVHQDTFELPPGAVLLASSSLYPHAFELGSAIGLQFHPEIDAIEAIQAVSNEDAEQLFRAGVVGSDFADQVRGAEAQLESAAARLFDAWLASI